MTLLRRQGGRLPVARGRRPTGGPPPCPAALRGGRVTSVAVPLLQKDRATIAVNSFAAITRQTTSVAHRRLAHNARVRACRRRSWRRRRRPKVEDAKRPKKLTRATAATKRQLMRDDVERDACSASTWQFSPASGRKGTKDRTRVARRRPGNWTTDPERKSTVRWEDAESDKDLRRRRHLRKLWSCQVARS